jgi:hypothetical protein
MSTLQAAGLPVVLRSVQKDIHFIHSTTGLLREVLESYFGKPWTIRYQDGIATVGRAIYYGATTLLATPTLGEEYSLIVPLVGLRYFPSAPRRIVFWFLSTFFPGLWKQLWPPSLQLWRILFHRWFVVLFLWTASYPSLIRLISNWKYASVFPLPLSISPSFYRLIASTHTLQASLMLAICLFYLHAEWKDKDKRKRMVGEDGNGNSVIPLLEPPSSTLDETVPFISSASSSASASTSTFPFQNQKCIVCLQASTTPTAMACGHVGCWECLLQWTSQAQRCPLCRRNQDPSRLIRCFVYPPCLHSSLSNK